MPKIILFIIATLSLVSTSVFAQSEAQIILEKKLEAVLKEKNTIVALAKLDALKMDASFVLRRDYFETLKIAYAKSKDPLVKFNLYRSIAWAARELHDTSLGYMGEKGLGADQGCVRDYAIVGPFENPSMENLEKALGPETGELGPFAGRFETIDWRKIPHYDYRCVVSLAHFIQPATSAVVYTSTTLDLPKAKNATLLLGSASAYKIWVNGKLVGESKDDFGLLVDGDAWKVKLKKGKNSVLIKFASTQEGSFAHILRVVDSKTLQPLPFKSSARLKSEKTTAAKITKDENGLGQQIKKTTKGSGDAAAWAAHYWAVELPEDAATPWRNTADRLMKNKKGLSSEALFQLSRTYEEYWKKRDILEEVYARKDYSDAAYALSDLYLEGLTLLDKQRSKKIIHNLKKEGFFNIWKRAEWEYNNGSKRKARRLFSPIWSSKVPAILRYKEALVSKFENKVELQKVRFALEKQTFNDGGIAAKKYANDLIAGNYDEALIYLRELRRWLPHSTALAKKEATILEAKGEAEKGLNILEERIKLSPGDSGLYEAKAELLIRMGEKEAATQTIKRILVYYPQDQNVKQRLRFLIPQEAAFYANWTIENVRERASKMKISQHATDTILEQSITKVSKNGLSTKFVQHVERVNTKEGKESAKYQRAYFQGGEEEAEVVKVIIHKKDGSISENFESWVSGGTRKKSTTYNDSATLFMEAKDVEVGDLIEFRYTISQVSSENFRGDYFGDIAYLQNTTPIGFERYAVIYPKTWKLFFRKPKLKHVRFDDKLPKGDAIEKDYHSTSFDFQNVPEVKTDQSQPGHSEVYDYISVSNKETYNEIGKWWWDLVHEQLIVDDEIKNKVKELTKGKKDDREKMKAIHNYVVRNTRYLHVGLGIHGWKPYRTTTCFRNRYGDCKDKAALLKVMLEEAGIKTNLVLVRTRSLGDLDEYPASMHIFNHAISYVPKFDLFLDGTAEYNGTTELTPMDQGARGIIIEDGGNARWVRLPVDKASNNLVVHEMDISVGGDITRIQGKIVAKGSNAVFYRHVLEDSERRDEVLEKQLSSLYPGTKLISAKYANLLNLEKETVIQYVVEGANILKSNGARKYLLPMGRTQNLLDRFAKSAKRYQDLTISTPFKSHTKIRYVLSKYALKTMPDNYEAKSRFGSIKIQYKKYGKEFLVDVEYSIDVQRISKDDYGAFREFLRDATQHLNTSIEVGKE